MKELAPDKILNIIPFSLATQECLDIIDEDESEAITHTFDSGKFAYIAKGAALELVNLSNGVRKSAANINSVNDQRTVTCLCSYESTLILGLKCQSSPGMICVYDPGVSRVTRAIKLSSVPLSLCVARKGGGVLGNPNLLNDSMKSFFGVLAVGTSNGHLYLLDLRMDDTDELYSLTSPSQMLIIDPAEIGNMPKQRDKARQNDQHCSIDLSGAMCTFNAYKFVSPTGKILKVCSADNRGITALTYVRQSLELVVGFSFGCFQIWSLEHLQLIYSSETNTSITPVTHFVIQEPDDDPRHCCYLWVGKSPLQNRVTSATSIELYQLLYEDKQTKPNYGDIFKTLECVLRRFEHKLTSDVHHLVDSRTIGSRIISFKCLEGDLSLCYLLWEAPTTDEGISCHLGVFDINRWYQNQLPSTLRHAMYGRMEPVCPFFTFYSMSDIAEKFLPTGILDVAMDARSWHTFRSLVGAQSEQFYWPSSSSFTVVCVSENGVINAQMLGSQKQILSDMYKMGTDSFLGAQDLIESCWVNGMLGSPYDVTRSDTDKRNANTMLTLALDHSGVGFISGCLKKWSHGSITHDGHSLKLIYEWAWNHVISRKKALDDLHCHLFGTTTQQIEDDNLNSLKKTCLELNNLLEVFKELQRSDVDTDEEGKKEIETRLSITTYLSLYSEVLLLLNESRMIPEVDGKVNKSTYPLQTLRQYYSNHRQQMSGMDAEEVLFVDLMWSRLKPLEREVQFDDEVKQYPPTTIETMCGFFLQNLHNEEIPLWLFYYWILDVCECCEPLQTSQASRKFKQCLKLSHNDATMVECCWLMDHQLYKEGMESLAQISVSIPAHYYIHIVKTLHHRQQHELLLAFCSCKSPAEVILIEDVKFIVRLFVELKLLLNAYNFQSESSRCKGEEKKEVFGYFVRECKNNGLLGKLISMALTEDEESMLKDLLKSWNETNYLFIYYLERGLYTEAMALSKQHEKKHGLMFNQVLQSEVNTRQLLVGGFLKTMPHSQQKRIQGDSPLLKRQRFNEGDTSRAPLSTVLQKSTANSPSVLYQAYQEFALPQSSLVTDILPNNKRRKSTLFDSEVVSKKVKELPKPAFQPSAIHKNRKHLYSGSDAFLLLKTPPVGRKSKPAQPVTIQNAKTPHSILKSRQKKATTATKVSTSEDETRKTLFDVPEPTPSRKIRFIGFASPTSPVPPPPTPPVAPTPLDNTPPLTPSPQKFDQSLMSEPSPAKSELQSEAAVPMNEELNSFLEESFKSAKEDDDSESITADDIIEALNNSKSFLDDSAYNKKEKSPKRVGFQESFHTNDSPSHQFAEPSPKASPREEIRKEDNRCIQFLDEKGELTVLSSGNEDSDSEKSSTREEEEEVDAILNDEEENVEKSIDSEYHEAEDYTEEKSSHKDTRSEEGSQDKSVVVLSSSEDEGEEERFSSEDEESDESEHSEISAAPSDDTPEDSHGNHSDQTDEEFMRRQPNIVAGDLQTNSDRQPSVSERNVFQEIEDYRRKTTMESSVVHLEDVNEDYEVEIEEVDNKKETAIEKEESDEEKGVEQYSDGDKEEDYRQEEEEGQTDLSEDNDHAPDVVEDDSNEDIVVLDYDDKEASPEHKEDNDLVEFETKSDESEENEDIDLYEDLLPIDEGEDDIKGEDDAEKPQSDVQDEVKQKVLCEETNVVETKMEDEVEDTSAENIQEDSNSDNTQMILENERQAEESKSENEAMEISDPNEKVIEDENQSSEVEEAKVTKTNDLVEQSSSDISSGVVASEPTVNMELTDIESVQSQNENIIEPEVDSTGKKEDITDSNSLKDKNEDQTQQLNDEEVGKEIIEDILDQANKNKEKKMVEDEQSEKQVEEPTSDEDNLVEPMEERETDEIQTINTSSEHVVNVMQISDHVGAVDEIENNNTSSGQTANVMQISDHVSAFDEKNNTYSGHTVNVMQISDPKIADADILLDNQERQDITENIIESQEAEQIVSQDTQPDQKGFEISSDKDVTKDCDDTWETEKQYVTSVKTRSKKASKRTPKSTTKTDKSTPLRRSSRKSVLASHVKVDASVARRDLSKVEEPEVEMRVPVVEFLDLDMSVGDVSSEVPTPAAAPASRSRCNIGRRLQNEQLMVAEAFELHSKVHKEAVEVPEDRLREPARRRGRRKKTDQKLMQPLKHAASEQTNDTIQVTPTLVSKEADEQQTAVEPSPERRVKVAEEVTFETTPNRRTSRSRKSLARKEETAAKEVFTEGSTTATSSDDLVSPEVSKRPISRSPGRRSTRLQTPSKTKETEEIKVESAARRTRRSVGIKSPSRTKETTKEENKASKETTEEESVARRGSSTSGLAVSKDQQKVTEEDVAEEKQSVARRTRRSSISTTKETVVSSQETLETTQMEQVYRKSTRRSAGRELKSLIESGTTLHSTPKTVTKPLKKSTSQDSVLSFDTEEKSPGKRTKTDSIPRRSKRQSIAPKKG